MAQDFDTLVAQVRRGDNSAFKDLAKLCEPKVRSILAALGPKPQFVEDLAQEVFVTVYMQLDDYRIGTDFQAWVSQITRNLARKELRRLSREAARLRDYRSMLQAVGAEEHLAQPNGEEMLDRLRECLRRLPPNQAQIVRQAYDSKTTWDELARLLGRTRNALRVLLHRIRRQLWQCLRQEVRV